MSKLESFELNAWYRVKKPNSNKRISSFLSWTQGLDQFDGKILQCKYSFFDGQHAFLGSNTSTGFHISWVVGPYNSHDEAQHALLNEAVSVFDPSAMEPVTLPWFAPSGIKPWTVSVKGSTGVPYAGSYGEYFKGKQEIKGDMKYDELFNKDVAQTFVGVGKNDHPMFYNTKKKSWVNFVLPHDDILAAELKKIVDDTGHHQPGETRSEWIDRQIEKLVAALAESDVKNNSGRDDLYGLLKAYVGEMVSAVSLSADKDLKKLEDQIECLKKELTGASLNIIDVAALVNVHDATNEKQTETINAVSRHVGQLREDALFDIENLKNAVCDDFEKLRKVVNYNADSAADMRKVQEEIILSHIAQAKDTIDLIAATDETVRADAELTHGRFVKSNIRLNKSDTRLNKLDSILIEQQNEIEDLQESEAATEELIELFSDDLDFFKEDLLCAIKDQKQSKVFEVGGSVYAIHSDKLWAFDAKTDLWTTVEVSSKLVGDAQLKSDLAKIDKKAEDDINKIYEAFHKRQEKSKETVARNKKEFDKETEMLEKSLVEPMKPSRIKRAAKWVAYTVGATVSTSAGIAAAVYVYPMIF